MVKPSFRMSQQQRLRIALLASAPLAFALAMPAHAADMSMPFKAPPMVSAQVYDWTGYYVGGQVGYTFGKDQLFEYFTGSGAYTGFARSNKVDGVSGGGFVGANYQTGYWVFGMEGDIEGGDLRGGWIDFPTGGQGKTKVDMQASLRGRIGVTYDRALFYATGGAAFGNVGHTYTNLTTRISETFEKVQTGWTAGGGVEVMFAPNWSVRGEYRYTDFGMTRADSATSFPGLTGTQHVKLNTARIGVAYKF